MAKRSGMYSSTKRKKELQRQKKQEEKRLKRQKNMKPLSEDPEEQAASDSGPDSTSEDTE